LGVPVTTDTAVNFMCPLGRHLEWIQIGTQTIISPIWTAGTGLDISLDATSNEGLELGCGPTAASGTLFKTIGVDNFRFRAKIATIDNVSGTDTFYVGLRKEQAYAPAVATYTDYAAIGCNTTAADMALKIMTDLDDAGQTTTDTTDTLLDGEYLDVQITVGEEARLQTCIDLCAGYKTAYNAHCANVAEHTTSVDSSNLITHAAPTTIATMIAFVTEAMADYVLHDADVVIATPSYHAATSAGDDLASVIPPLNLAECVTRLNDLKAKYNLHEGDATSHGGSSAHTLATINASSTWFQMGSNAVLSDPPTSINFDFNAGDVIVPFIHYINGTANWVATMYLQEFELVDTFTV